MCRKLEPNADIRDDLAPFFYVRVRCDAMPCLEPGSTLSVPSDGRAFASSYFASHFCSRGCLLHSTTKPIFPRGAVRETLKRTLVAHREHATVGCL